MKTTDRKNEIYCSTGTVIGRATCFDHSVICRELPKIAAEVGLDGIEHVVVPAFYDGAEEKLRMITSSGLRCAVLHADKRIGVMLSQGGEENAREAMRLWRVNCMIADSLDCSRVVLHLWGSTESDANFAYNASFMDEILSIAGKYDIETLIENIPCVSLDPLSRWRELDGYGCGFIFDVRFGQLHGQNGDIVASEYMKNGRISHMHISDFGGGFREFSKIRPILHPNEGNVDFPALFAGLKAAGYRGSFTLESPVMSERGLDLDKLTRTLLWLREQVASIWA